MKKAKMLKRLLSFVAILGSLPIVINASTNSKEQSADASKPETKKFKVTIKCNYGGVVKVGGSVAIDGRSIEQYYDEGSEITIESLIYFGYNFFKWSDGSYVSKRTITINGDISLCAYFKEYHENQICLNTGIKFSLTDNIDLNQFCLGDEDKSMFITTADGKSFNIDKEDIETLEIYNYNRNIKSIGDNFLNRFNNLKTLKIDLAENDVTSIGNNFLAHCDELTSKFELPKNLESFGDYFMQYCQQFNQELVMPDTLVFVGAHPFYGCRHLKSCNIINDNFNMLHKNAVWVDGKRYYLIDNLDPNIFCASSFFERKIKWGGWTVDLPLLDGSIKTIDGQDITAVDFVTCNRGIKKIDDNFLYRCSKLSSIDFTGLLFIESVGDNFLYDCEKINQEIKLPSLKSFGKCFMEACNSYNQPFTIPYGITCIEDGFLSGCDDFNNELYIPRSVTTIKKSFLKQCKNFN